MLHVRTLVRDRRILDEIDRQIRCLSYDEFRVLNSLPFREFEDVVNGAIFDAGEKIKFWERFQEGLATGRSRLGAIPAKARMRIAAILKREMSAASYRDMNRLTDSGFRDALRALFEAMADAGALSMAPGAVADAIREAAAR